MTLGRIPLPLKCEVTRNECGTDTWAANDPCKCSACVRYVLGREIDSLYAIVARERALADRLADALRCCSNHDEDSLAVLAEHAAARKGKFQSTTTAVCPDPEACQNNRAAFGVPLHRECDPPGGL